MTVFPFLLLNDFDENFSMKPEVDVKLPLVHLAISFIASFAL